MKMFWSQGCQVHCQVCGKRITEREREREKGVGEGVRRQAAKFGSKMFAGFALLWF